MRVKFCSLNTGALNTSLSIVLGILLMSICAQIYIEIWPVPITLQTVATMIIALTFNKKSSFLSLLTYLTLGLAGAPIFSNLTGGIAKLQSPAFGYLIGMMITSYVIPCLKEKTCGNSQLISYMLLCTIGQTIIYVCGIVWLSYFIGYNKAILSGFIVFIPSGIVKAIILSAILRYLKK